MITIITVIIASITLITFSLLIMLAALHQRAREPVVFHLAFYSVLGFLLSLSLMATLLPTTVIIIPDQLHRVVFEFVPLAMILTFGALSLSFLKKPTKYLVGYWIVALLILALWNILKFNIGAIQTTISGISQIAPPTLLLSGLGWLIALGATFIGLATDFRKRRAAQYLNRLRYWLITSTLVGTSGLVLFINPAVFNWAGLFLLWSGTIVAGYNVLSYQTPDLKLLVGRALHYSGGIVILSTILFVAMAAIVTISHEGTPPGRDLLWAAGIAIALAAVFPPLWQISDRFLLRIIFGRERADQQQLIKHYSQSVSSVLDMNRMGDTLINMAIETLNIQQGIVFVNERSGPGEVLLRPLSSVGMGEISQGYFAPGSPFIEHLRQGEKHLSQYDVDMLPKFRSMPQEEQAWLSNLGIELYIPVLRHHELVGMLAFGPHPQGTTYDQEEIDLMIALANQTALAIDSARLFEQLSMVNQQVGSLTDRMANIDQSKTDFLSITSHELRTPLTHIQGYSRMLLDLTEEELNNPAYLKKMIEGIAKGSERMKSVVDMMLDVSEADIGEMNLFRGPVDLDEVIDLGSKPYLSALDERRIAFGKEGIKELPVIQADGTRLVQAFENLIGNAVKFTPDGGTVKIEGRTVTRDDIGEAVEIVVSDTGIGIDPEHHDRIFEKFYRVDDLLHHSTGKTKFKGAGPGLGLTLVKAIAETHGGITWVESPGYDEENFPGSKFYLVLPLEGPPEPEAAPEKMSQSQIETRHWRRGDIDKEIEAMDEAAKKK